MQIFTVPSAKYPSPIIQCAKPRGVNISSIFNGKTFIYLPFISLYQKECNLEIIGKHLVENQYCVGSLPINLGFGQGVDLDLLHIKAKASYFKYLTYCKFLAENVNSNLPLICGVFLGLYLI